MEQWKNNARREPVIIDLDTLVPKDHLLRKIEKVMDYEWLYERLAPYYCHENGRPGTDPVVLIKMVLIQHLFGIPSLRQTYRDIQVNVAYRWFLGYSLSDKIPHFSTVSYNFKHRYSMEVIDKVFESEYLNSECIQVSVYMDFFNVHVNYWPVSGEVKYYKYHPGKYMLAFLPKASELNEHTSTAISSPFGEVFFKQIAGTFARRIVCYATPGEQEVKGSECGIIKFGSRIDMYFPLDAEIRVKLGDHVKASESIIATLHK